MRKSTAKKSRRNNVGVGEWSRPTNTGPSPSARCAHTTVQLQAGKLFIFGGWDGRMLNDLIVLHTDTMTWSKPITTGDAPGPRAGHAACAVGTKIFIFGGGNGSHYLNDLYVLDTETMRWAQAYVAGSSPSARSRHSMTLVGTNQLFVIGGGDDSRVYNDIYVLNTDTMSWSRPVLRGGVPVVRWGHTATIMEKKIYVIGGHDGKKMLSSMCILDTQRMVWQQIQLHGIALSPRAGHSTTLVLDKLFVFGGGDGVKILDDLYIIDPSTLVVSRPNLSRTAPPARCAHTSSICGVEGDALLVFGGGDGSRRFKDLYLLDVVNLLKREGSIKKEKSGKTTRETNKIDSTVTAIKKSNITEFLTSIGLAEHAPRFAKENIDILLLPFLSESHLEKLGISTIGERLKFIAAVQILTPPSKIESTDRRSLPSSSPRITPSFSEHELKDLSCVISSIQSSLDTLTLAISNLSSRIEPKMFIKEKENEKEKEKEEEGNESKFVVSTVISDIIDEGRPESLVL